MRIVTRRIALGLLTIVTTVGILVGSAVAEDSRDEMFNRIRVIYNVVSAWHKDSVDLNKFVDGAIRGGLSTLNDPYTSYFSPDEFSDFMETLNGTFSGIGAYLEQSGSYIVISSPIKGSPAARAGIMSGDRILEVNGTALTGFTTDGAVKLIRGPAGSTVILKIERPSEQRTFTVSVVREQINIPEVESRMLEDAVGYIQITSFGDDAVRDFYAAVGRVKQQGAKVLVLDLRQNGGGYLNAAVDIASAFVAKDQPIVWEVGKDGKEAITSSGRLVDLPVVVLVDGGTASASEILAGAIQDYGAGQLVGVKTFGKGTVQQILTLTMGGGIKVTIAEYLTAKEHHVHGIGLTPDYQVENPKPSPERTTPMEFKHVMLPSTAGLDVLYLQYRLQDLGYDVETTGFFGLKTAEAVSDFASANNLGNEPVVTEAFLKELNARVQVHQKDVQLPDVQLQKALDLARAKLK